MEDLEFGASGFGGLRFTLRRGPQGQTTCQYTGFQRKSTVDFGGNA